MPPAELVHEILQFLTASEYPLRYGYDKDVLHALSQLCLVNHFFYDISVSYLYSSIIITQNSQLQALTDTLHSSIILCSYTHSLSFPNFFCDLYPSSPLVPLLCNALNLVNPYLRRLSLWAAVSDFACSSLMKETFDRFTDLEEFLCIGNAGRPDIHIWSGWPNLHRLLLEGAEVSESLIKAVAMLPSLTQLGLLNAVWHGSFQLNPTHEFDVRPIVELSEASRSLRMIILGFPWPLGRFSPLFVTLRTTFSKISYNQRSDVRYIQLPINGWSSRVMDSMASDGSFWELDSESLINVDEALFDERLA